MLRYRLSINTVIENPKTKVGDINKTEEGFETPNAAFDRYLQLINERIADPLTISYLFVIIDKETGAFTHKAEMTRMFIGQPQIAES